MKCEKTEEEFLCLTIADNEKEVEKFFHDSSEFDSIVSGTAKRLLGDKVEVVTAGDKAGVKSVEEVKKPVEEVKKPVEKKAEVEKKSEEVEEKAEEKPESDAKEQVEKVDEEKKPKEETKVDKEGKKEVKETPEETKTEVKPESKEAEKTQAKGTETKKSEGETKPESKKAEETEKTQTEAKEVTKEDKEQEKKIYSYPIYKNKVGRVCVDKKTDLKSKRQACSKVLTSCLMDSKDLKSCPNFGGKVNFSSPQKGETIETPKKEEKESKKTKTPKSNHYFIFFSFLLCTIIFGTVMSLSRYYKSEFLKNKQAPFRPPSWAPQSLFPADPFYYEHELVRPMVDEYLR